MRVLLDTHALIWALFDSRKLSAEVQCVIEDTNNDICVSSVSFWEVSLKYSLERLEMGGIEPDELPLAAVQSGFTLLSLEAEAASSFYRLPRDTHRDPFDRMLVWQSITMKLPLVSRDKGLDAYTDQGLQRLW